MTKNGGYVWIQSHLTIVHNSRSSRPHCIVSVNYVVSERQEPDLVINSEQLSTLSRSNFSNPTSSSWLDYNESTSASPSPNSTRRPRRSQQIQPQSQPQHLEPLMYSTDSSDLHDQRLMSIPNFEYQADFTSQLSDTWYPNQTRLDYQDSPIQWHSNPMYSGMEDLDPRNIDYGIQAASTSIPPISTSVQQRSISRTSIYSTSSSDQEGNNVVISNLEPVPRSRQHQSLGEIEMVSSNGHENKSKDSSHNQ